MELGTVFSRVVVTTTGNPWVIKTAPTHNGFTYLHALHVRTTSTGGGTIEIQTATTGSTVNLTGALPISTTGGIGGIDWGFVPQKVGVLKSAAKGNLQIDSTGTIIHGWAIVSQDPSSGLPDA